MKSSITLMQELAQMDIRLGTSGDKLRVDGPTDGMTTELENMLSDHKQELLMLLNLEQRGLRYELEERAAILEYDGGLDRGQAENQAINELFERTNQLTIDGRQIL